jgi:hypothetical protein
MQQGRMRIHVLVVLTDALSSDTIGHRRGHPSVQRSQALLSSGEAVIGKPLPEFTMSPKAALIPEELERRLN